MILIFFTGDQQCAQDLDCLVSFPFLFALIRNEGIYVPCDWCNLGKKGIDFSLLVLNVFELTEVKKIAGHFKTASEICVV